MNTDALGLSVPVRQGPSDFLSQLKLRKESAEQKLPEFEETLRRAEPRREDGRQVRSMAQRPGNDSPKRDDIEIRDRVSTDSPEERNPSNEERSESSVKNRRDGREEVLQALLSRSQGQVPTPQHQAMLKFMDSMESELGIPPTRIVEAMAGLTADQLLSSPEASSQQVIANLNLEAEQQERAMALYAGLLTQLAQLSQISAQPNQLSRSSAELDQLRGPTDSAVSMEELGRTPINPDLLPTAQRREILNQSLDRMSERFFVDSMKASQKMAANGTPPEMSLMSNSDLVAKLQGQQMSQTPIEGAPLEGFAAGLASEVSGRGSQGLAGSAAKSGNYSAGAGMALAGAGASAVVPGAMAADSGSSSGQMMEFFAGQGNSAAMASLTGPSESKAAVDFAALAAEASADALDADASLDAGSEIGADALNSGTAAGSSNSLSGTTQVGLGEGSGLGNAGVGRSDSSGDPNVRQIMNQAQYMISKGGGQTVMKLQPEGLGEIHLKIGVHQGKVNVEMMADTQEAKRLLEGSLDDLRNSLSSQKLSVEGVKVDVSQSSSSDSQQRQPNSGQQDQNRDQLRQMFSQWREENGRSQFFEMPGIKAYNRTQSPTPLGPAPIEGARSRRFSGEHKGNGLNLVA